MHRAQQHSHGSRVGLGGTGVTQVPVDLVSAQAHSHHITQARTADGRSPGDGHHVRCGLDGVGEQAEEGPILLGGGKVLWVLAHPLLDGLTAFKGASLVLAVEEPDIRLNIL